MYERLSKNIAEIDRTFVPRKEKVHGNKEYEEDMIYPSSFESNFQSDSFYDEF